MSRESKEWRPARGDNTGELQEMGATQPPCSSWSIPLGEIQDLKGILDGAGSQTLTLPCSPMEALPRLDQALVGLADVLQQDGTQRLLVLQDESGCTGITVPLGHSGASAQLQHGRLQAGQGLLTCSHL